MDLFLLKKIISLFIMPINIILLLLFCAIIFYKKRPALSFKCLIASTVLLLLSTLPVVSDRLMVPFENSYEVFSRSSTPIDYIVVLGCGHTTNDELPPTSQLKVCSLQRIVEAVRIYNLHPEATLITSGYSGIDPVSNAEKVKQAALLLGVPNNKIITENFPQDTEEEAELIAPRVIGTKVVLVTNADHMPRSMRYFQAQGVNPIAAPTGYWVKNLQSEKKWDYYFPNAKKLAQTTTAWYETLGLIVQWFKSLFS
jgi:uncharacterized SAM-binding protein YcdF (DUF218 family)